MEHLSNATLETCLKQFEHIGSNVLKYGNTRCVTRILTGRTGRSVCVCVVVVCACYLRLWRMDLRLRQRNVCDWLAL